LAVVRDSLPRHGYPPAVARSASPTVNVHQIKVVLRGAEPPIWRRLQVPASMTLADLHHVLQVAMGWGDCHLHQFTIAGVRYGIDDGEGWGLACKDERRAKLYQVARKGATFGYEYDFGDGWEHDIFVENVIPVEAAYPVCLAGERACPPEDCGGVWGYDDFLRALADPAREDGEELLEWVVGEFDPERFDLAAVNRALAPAGRQRTPSRV
jgi:hypothetical protein